MYKYYFGMVINIGYKINLWNGFIIYLRYFLLIIKYSFVCFVMVFIFRVFVFFLFISVVIGEWISVINVGFIIKIWWV